MKYPIGIQTFEKVIEGGYVYVDKTDLVYSLVSNGSIYFLSRPRRFGKSLLMSTLKSYFLGRRELFRGLKIESLEHDWKTYPVFHIDFSAGMYNNGRTLDEVLEIYLGKWEVEYGVTKMSEDYGVRFREVLAAASKKCGMGCVVLVDEYDKPLLDVLDTGLRADRDGDEVVLEEYNKDALKSLYSAFKGADEHLKFVFLTGVTKFAQISVFSGFNQPDDISMSERYDTICGITDDEVEHYFGEAVQQLAGKRGVTVDEMRGLLRQRYDGYHFSSGLCGVYNPFSLLNTFNSRAISDYWFSTGTPTYLLRLLDHFGEGVNELTGKYYSKSEFDDYRADVASPLPMIYQSGYMTVKAYDARKEKFLLDFPNDEVKRGFLTLVAGNYLKGGKRVGSWLDEAVEALDGGNIDKFRDNLTSFLASIPYDVRRKETERERERYFSYTFYLLLRIASTYVTYTEKRQSQGRVDCVIETANYVYIFEFKLDGTAREALEQIETMGYAREYKAIQDRLLLLVGDWHGW